MADDAYLDAYSSIVNYLQRCREDLMESEVSPDLNYRDLDGHAEDAIIENMDFLFTKDFSGELEDKFRYWTILIGVSTFEDLNLFRHRKIMNYLLNRFLPLTTIPLYDNETLKKKKGSLIVQDPVTVMPFSKYNTRAVQYFLVSVASTETTHERQLPDHTSDLE